MKKLILCAFALMFAACAGTSTTEATVTPTTVTDADLAHHRYDLQSVNGTPIDASDPVRQPRIEFNEGMQVSGIVCNSFAGTLKLENGFYTGMMAATRMACLSDVLNQAETVLFKAFTDGAEFNLSGNELSISNNGDVLLFMLNDYK